MRPHDARRPQVVVYHSAYGLRPAIIDFADKLRAPRIPDLDIRSDLCEKFTVNRAIRYKMHVNFNPMASTPRFFVTSGIWHSGIFHRTMRP
jgi:hypothetical protein